MGEADWFAAICAVFALGAGALMAAFGERVMKIGGIACMGTAIAGLVFWFGYYRHADAQSPPIINNAPSINTFNQSGGNNVINQAPTPSVRMVEKTESANPDGSYSRRFHIAVANPFAATRLVVGAKGPDLVNVDLVPDASGTGVGGGVMINVAKGSCGDQCLGVQIGAPVVANYWVYVVTKQKEEVSLVWNVQ
jgi:hypothetical protein